MGIGGEERWRGSRGPQSSHTPSVQSNQKRQPSGTPYANPPSQERPSGEMQGGMTEMSGNAWTMNNRRSRDGPTHEQHTPVKGFNAQEIRDALKKAIASVAAEELKSLRYKATGGPATNVKTGGPWASKVNTMSSGKDFFLELRKQMAALQHLNERAGG